MLRVISKINRSFRKLSTSTKHVDEIPAVAIRRLTHPVIVAPAGLNYSRRQFISSILYSHTDSQDPINIDRPPREYSSACKGGQANRFNRDRNERFNRNERPDRRDQPDGADRNDRNERAGREDTNFMEDWGAPAVPVVSAESVKATVTQLLKSKVENEVAQAAMLDQDMALTQQAAQQAVEAVVKQFEAENRLPTEFEARLAFEQNYNIV